MSAALQDNSALLLFRVGPVYCCAPSQQVTSVITPPALTRPPGCTPAEPGIFRHSGKLVRVSDLRVRFGVNHDSMSPSGRVVIADFNDHCTGFQVDEIISVIRFPTQGWGPLPALLPRGVFNRTLELENHIFLYAELARLDTLKTEGYLSEYVRSFNSYNPTPSTATETTANRHPGDTRDTSSATRETPPTLSEKAPRHEGTPEASPVHIPQTDITKKSTFTNPNKTAPIKVKSPDPVSLSPSPGTEPAKIRISTQSPELTNIRSAAAHKPQTPPTSSETPAGSSHAGTNSNVLVSTSQPDQLRPATFSNSQDTRETDEHDGVSVGVILAVLLIFLALPFGFAWWFFSIQEPEPGVHIPVPVDSTRVEEVSPQWTMESSTTVGKSVAAQTSETDDRNNNVETITPSAAPFASVSQDDEGVTIVVEETPPLPELPSRQKQTEGEGEIPVVSVDEETVTPKSVPVDPSPVGTSLKNNGQPTAFTITNTTVHVVVKGDTLWAIAKRYVKDPFRYPELAKLNRIRNPDLIYPGDKVRIITIQRH